MGKRKIKTCAYCGEIKRCGKDHIPPRSIFDPVDPGDLITVPCCEECRETQPKDDEFFRFFIHSGTYERETSGSDPVFGSIYRSIQKPAAKGLRERVLRSIGEREVVTEGGLYIGKIPTVTGDGIQIRSVGSRIVKGLFYHENKKPLPPNYAVHIKFIQTVIEPGLLEIIKGLEFKPFEETGHGKFRFTHAIMDNDEFSTFWVMVFSEGLIMLGWTGDPTTRKKK